VRHIFQHLKARRCSYGKISSRLVALHDFEPAVDFADLHALTRLQSRGRLRVDDPERLGSSGLPLRSVGSVAFPERSSFLMITIRILHVCDATLVRLAFGSPHAANSLSIAEDDYNKMRWIGTKCQGNFVLLNLRTRGPVGDVSCTLCATKCRYCVVAVYGPHVQGIGGSGACFRLSLVLRGVPA
jgi:hypothetical protein